MVEELEATVQWMTREVDESMDPSFLVGRCAPASQHGVCGATARISCQLLAASFGVSSSPELHQHLVVFFKFSDNSFGRDRLQHCSVLYTMYARGTDTGHGVHHQFLCLLGPASKRNRSLHCQRIE
jgi:hypothetical protein